ncbi:MAG: iron-containing redox enzyme family protein [Archangium sp.]|nr:iron-containing redox enzyme family protein [Archangium sp.]
MKDIEPFFKQLDAAMAEEWDVIVKVNPFFNALMDGLDDRRLLGIYLCEVYNTVKHSAITQALVVQHLANPTSTSIRYMKYCLNHALEEVGHEQMALHDLRSLGVDITNETMPRPTIATEAFTGYVYRLATTGNPVQRLGYSYWAENCYTYFAPIAMAIVQNMKLEAKNLTFFVQHGEIDKKHADEVKKIIADVVSTQADKDAILTALRGTIRLQGGMLADVHAAYLKFLKGEAPMYDFVRNLA